MIHNTAQFSKDGQKIILVFEDDIDASYILDFNNHVIVDLDYKNALGDFITYLFNDFSYIEVIDWWDDIKNAIKEEIKNGSYDKKTIDAFSRLITFGYC